MEPDFDKIVSNKIRQAEQQPVSWNKQAVWQNLQKEGHATRHDHYFYYAAAATILLLIYFAIGVTPNEIPPRPTDAQVKAGQEATKPQRLSAPEENWDLASHPANNRKKNTATNPVMEIPNNVHETTDSVRSKTKEADAVIEPILADIKISEEELLLLEEVAIPERKIRPVVGVITESYSEKAAKVKQKKPLRKLEPADPVPWEDPANALVFVVRK